MTALDVRAEECTAEQFLTLVENHDASDAVEPSPAHEPLLPVVRSLVP